MAKYKRLLQDPLEDLIELELTEGPPFPVYLSLSDQLPVKSHSVILVGYPGYPDAEKEKIRYKSTPNYFSHRPSFLPELKSVSYGRFETVEDRRVLHSCSTEEQSSGSPMFDLSDCSVPALVRAVHISCGVDDHLSRNYNVAIHTGLWRIHQLEFAQLSDKTRSV